ncbi:MAG: DNA starvation/stationary phase protection protein Dps [Anaeromyxobacter sp.]
MNRSPNPMPESNRRQVTEALNAVLADSLDLHGHLKSAHWNLKGPHFAALHPLLETFAVSLAAHGDTVAERAVTLGGRAYGTARHVAGASRLPPYPEETVRDLEHVRHLSERIDAYLAGVRQARAAAQGLGDDDTVDVLTAIVEEFEKHGWFLRATLGE